MSKMGEIKRKGAINFIVLGCLFFSVRWRGALCVEMDFTRTYIGKQNITAEAKFDVIFIRFW